MNFAGQKIHRGVASVCAPIIINEPPNPHTEIVFFFYVAMGEVDDINIISFKRPQPGTMYEYEYTRGTVFWLGLERLWYTKRFHLQTLIGGATPNLKWVHRWISF